MTGNRWFKAKYSLNMLCFACLVLFGTSLKAQEQDSLKTRAYAENDRQWLLEAPVWIPGLRGQFSFGDLDFSSGGGGEEREFDRLNGDTGLEFYFSGRFQVDLGRFQLYADGFTGRIGTSFSLEKEDGSESELVYFRINGSLVRFLAGYQFYESTVNQKRRWSLYGQLGVRYINLGFTAEVPSLGEVVDTEPSYFEPMIGLLAPVDLGRFRIEIQSDVSVWEHSFSWAISNRYRYRISPLVDVQLGWTWLNLDYENRDLQKEVSLDISLFGPTAGVGFWLQ